MSAANDKAGAADAADTPIENPCPVCLTNETRPLLCENFMCYECGQLFCEECFSAESVYSVDLCPMCRTPLHEEREKHEERLRRLLARSPGPHTPVAQTALGAMLCVRGRELGDRQALDEGLGLLRRAADAGSALALHNLAMSHRLEDAVEEGRPPWENRAESARLFGLAAEAGYTRSMFELAVCYLDGDGVMPDAARAVELLKQAADKRHVGSWNRLAQCFATGQGVAKDYDEAARYFRLAADRGDDAGQFNLALLYECGKGVPLDDAEAVRLFSLVAERESSQAAPTARYKVGAAHFSGRGVEQDHREAVRHYRIAAEHGHMLAQRELARCLVHGMGCLPDNPEAEMWYERWQEQEARQRP